MKFTRSAAFKCALLLVRSGTIVLSGELTANPPDGVHLLYEELSSLSLGWYDNNTVAVDSNIPVSIQRYYDEDYFFMMGMQPVKENDMVILVTSNCNSSATSVIPDVTVNSTVNNDDGQASTSVTIQLDGVDSTTEFLKPSSYHAIWSYTSGWCSADTPGSGGVSTQSEQIDGTTPSSACRRSFLLSVLSILQVVLSKRDIIQRTLEPNDCVFNAEILLDGCKHDINIAAPSVRVVNSTMVNYTSVEVERCTTNYDAVLTFDSDPVLEGNSTLFVPKMRGDVCARPIEGRPFVDSLGNTLFAAPMIVNASALASWSASKQDDAIKSSAAQGNSSTIGNVQSLGQEWTMSALGEHASIASFAAFSIALMTNGAPSTLVEDALNAALDEVRHARTSFAIASKLRGEDVGPSSLPESQHEFGHDLKPLAIAVAKEGCIDETLSALDAAYKAKLIEFVIESEFEGTKYSGVDKDTLAWMQKELSVIAIEESNHSLLAWRTLDWICSVDSNVCNEVKSSIFQDHKLERAIHQRFGSAESLPMMQLLVGHYLEAVNEERRNEEVDLHDVLTEAARNLMIQRHGVANSSAASSCHF